MSQTLERALNHSLSKFQRAIEGLWKVSKVKRILNRFYLMNVFPYTD